MQRPWGTSCSVCLCLKVRNVHHSTKQEITQKCPTIRTVKSEKVKNTNDLPKNPFFSLTNLIYWCKIIGIEEAVPVYKKVRNADYVFTWHK
jgi:hypothetical protein